MVVVWFAAAVICVLGYAKGDVGFMIGGVTFMVLALFMSIHGVIVDRLEKQRAQIVAWKKERQEVMLELHAITMATPNQLDDHGRELQMRLNILNICLGL